MADFACSDYSVAFVLKGGAKRPESFVPEKPDTVGLVHFYRKDKAWSFVTADEYEAKKDELPDVCFATHHPIKDFNSKEFPELESISFDTKDAAADAKPEYYAKFTVDSTDKEVQYVTATEKEALEGGCAHDMNPVIYIRSKKPAKDARDVTP